MSDFVNISEINELKLLIMKHKESKNTTKQTLCNWKWEKEFKFSYKQVQILVSGRIWQTTEVNEMPYAQPE